MKLRGIAAVLALCAIPLTGYAAYPDSGGIVNFNEVYDVPGTASWVPSDRENIFTVDGKGFILLDTDAEGNYFVLAEEHYGQYPFERGIPNTVPLAEAVTVNGKTTFTDKGADLTDTESWRFQPQRENNIAYWLNHQFAADGNTKEYQLPRKVYDNILERTWDVEGFQCYTGWTAAQWYDQHFGVNTAANSAAAFRGKPYSVTAKIALLSYSEYMQYKDKIGITVNNSEGWAGLLLRTCDAMVTCTQAGNTKKLNLVRAPLMVKTKNADRNDHGLVGIRTADAISSNYYYVRPCFWLSKDFFKTVACDLEYDAAGNPSIGAAPLAKIKAHSYEELRSIYTDGQLESMGYTIPERDIGNYPAHPSQVQDLGAGERGNIGLPEYYESPAENLFTVDGKSFILLDRDENGNWLVMANEEYGQYAFSAGVASSDKQCTDADWYFNPDNPKSIAYWLNHQFLTEGGQMKFTSEKLLLPQSIRDHMLLADWEIEPHYPIKSWTVASYASAASKAEIEQWMQSQIVAAQKRTVRCKVALPSFTEYQAYKEKIGLTVLAAGYGGFSLRTPRAQAQAAEDSTWSALIGQLQVANNDAVKGLVFTTAGVNNDTYYVRPVFWLDRTFFANVAIDVNSVGDAVKNEIAYSYDYFDMRQLYSEEQLRQLGIKIDRAFTAACPAADNVIIRGVPAAGGSLAGVYRYVSNDGLSGAAAERNSKYAWYIADTPAGAGIKCSDQQTYEPAETDVGKYLYFGVTPQNAYGIAAEMEYRSRPVLIEAQPGIRVVAIAVTDKDGRPVSKLNGVPELHVRVEAETAGSYVMFVAAYTQDGTMTALNSVAIQPGVNGLALSNISGGGAYARVMIFEAGDLSTPVYSKKI